MNNVFHPQLDPEKMPLFMALSTLAAFAIAMIVYRFSSDLVLAILVAVLMVIVDYLTLTWLMQRNKEK